MSPLSKAKAKDTHFMVEVISAEKDLCVVPELVDVNLWSLGIKMMPSLYPSECAGRMPQ
jgi:hypothetical protein